MKGGERGGGKKKKHTLSTTCESTTTGLLWSRSSWLTAVGEERAGGGAGGGVGGGGLPTGREGLWEGVSRERERERRRMCLLMRSSEKSHQGLFFSFLSAAVFPSAAFSVTALLLVNYDPRTVFTRRRHARTSIRTRAHTRRPTKPPHFFFFMRAGYDGNLASSIEILFVVPGCDPR